MEELFNKYYQYVLNWAFYYSRDKEVAQDMASQVFIKLLSNKNKVHFEYESQAKSYLKKSVKHLWIDNYRKDPKVIHKDIEDQNILDRIPDNRADNTYSDEILFVLNNLNDSFKIPLLMFLEGYKYREISDYLDLPLGTVKQRIHRAKKDCLILLLQYRKKFQKEEKL